jgi:O-antigen ligase
MDFHRYLLLRSGFCAIQKDALPVFLCVLCGLERVERAGERFLVSSNKDVNVNSLTKTAELTQWLAFTGLLIFTPLAHGATTRWTFCISLWLVLLALTAMVLKRAWQGDRLIPRSPLDFPVVLLLVLAAGSWFVSIYEEATFWALLRLLLYIIVFYLAVEATASRSQTRMLLITLLGMGTLISIVGLIKYFGGPVPSFWIYGKQGITLLGMGTLISIVGLIKYFGGPVPSFWIYGKQGQLNSTFVNRNHFAGYLEMVFALGLGFTLCRPFIRTLIWSSCLFLILVALLFSMSRGGWMATLCSLLFMGILFFRQKGVSKVKIRLATVALILIAGLSFLGSNLMFQRFQSLGNSEEPSLVSRVSVWEGSGQLIRENPLHGTGLGTFPWSFAPVRPAGLTLRWREAHNDYIHIATEMGLPVLIPVLWGLLLVFRTGLRTFRETESRFRAGVTLGALGGIVAILFHSLGDFNIQITSNGILFSVLIGLVIGQGRKEHSYLSEGS